MHSNFGGGLGGSRVASRRVLVLMRFVGPPLVNSAAQWGASDASSVATLDVGLEERGRRERFFARPAFENERLCCSINSCSRLSRADGCSEHRALSAQCSPDTAQLTRGAGSLRACEEGVPFANRRLLHGVIRHAGETYLGVHHVLKRQLGKCQRRDDGVVWLRRDVIRGHAGVGNVAQQRLQR
jgi:hypothetical protein